jgi:hypothetical protein
MSWIAVSTITKINAYRHNSRIVTMKLDPVGGVSVVELPLERREPRVDPGCVA